MNQTNCGRCLFIEEKCGLAWLMQFETMQGSLVSDLRITHHYDDSGGKGVLEPVSSGLPKTGSRKIHGFGDPAIESVNTAS